MEHRGGKGRDRKSIYATPEIKFSSRTENKSSLDMKLDDGENQWNYPLPVTMLRISDITCVGESISDCWM